MLRGNVFMRSVSAIVCIWAIAAMAYTVPANNRVKFDLDVGWKVYQGDPANAQASTFNDSGPAGRPRPCHMPGTGLPPLQPDAICLTASRGIGRISSFPPRMRGIKYSWKSRRPARLRMFISMAPMSGFTKTVSSDSVWISAHMLPFGGTDNVIAVRIDNYENYTVETAGNNIGTAYQWSTASYTSNFGGITQNAYLHVTPTIYQTLPLFSNLSTIGVYIYAFKFQLFGNQRVRAATGARLSPLNPK